MLHRLSPAFRASLALVTVAGALLFATSCARPAACQRNSDCDRAYCFEGECKRDCLDDERDCPEGWVCNVNAQCVPLNEGPIGWPDASAPDDAGDDGGMGGAGGAGGSDDLDAGTDSGDGSFEDDGGIIDDGGVEPPRPLGLLDLCSDDAECEGDFMCRPMWVNGPKRCTRSCTTSAQCMTGTRCETVGGERYCAQTDIGKACSTNDDCNSRCMTLRGYCTSQCNTGADCPNGYGCTAVGDPPVRMCVKVSIYCDDNPSVCAGGSPACEHDDIPISSCTIPCNSSTDCPQRATALGDTWKCMKQPNWTTGYCMRPADVYGPIPGGGHTEYLCAPGTTMVVNACNDGINTDVDAWYTPSPPPVNCNAAYTKPGVAGDTCVDSCRYQGACAFGFSCAAISEVSGQRLGLCLPTGGGEVGDPCTKHRDCAFGYCNLDTGTCSRDCSADGICPSGSTCTPTGAFIEGIQFKRCE